jgi:hypothetical protein
MPKFFSHSLVQEVKVYVQEWIEYFLVLATVREMIAG